MKPAVKRACTAGIPFVLLLAMTFTTLSVSAKVDTNLYAGMQWRLIGPFRGGRIGQVVGVSGKPNVYYASAEDGGMWKTTNAGATWFSLFKNHQNDSVGSFAIAHSNPNVIYVGSGEATQRPDLSIGNGLYKSTNGGKTWQHMGLRKGQQISAIAIDPHNASRLFVAVLGHPYGPNKQRGIFRSNDGGATFKKVLYKGENVGAADVALDPSNANVVYAVLWAARNTPWLTQVLQDAPGSGLYKSTDGGDTWHKVGNGLPAGSQHLGRIRLAIAPSDPNRIYASVRSGMYVSNDAGLTFHRVSDDKRNAGGMVTVAPNDPDEVYVSSTALYRSTNAGKSFTAIRGAPGGNDYHHLWINPVNPNYMAVGVDQGASVTVNGGKTWSLWYNQPTGQFYHVATDGRFPYHIYASQQDSGTLEVTSRGNGGQITFRDWHATGGEEYAYMAPDPLNPNIVYEGQVTKDNLTTGEAKYVGPQLHPLVAQPQKGKYRFNRTAPLIFSTVDPHILYLGSNVLFKTTNGGHSWKIISPDLTRTNPGIPASLGVFGKGINPSEHRGVIYSIGPSLKDTNTIWAGTDDGLIWVTHDGGKHWNNVTPSEMGPWDKVTQIVSSHFSDNTAYASVSRFRLNDLTPYIYRTHDGGKSWKLITNGLPDNAPVNVVREDPVKKGLLFAGTDRGVWFSTDNGDDWHSLQLNLPTVSMRDLVIHDNDVILATHGRGLWILDDITPLGQLAKARSAQQAYLYKPEVAYQIPKNTYSGTQLPKEFPAGKNPPSGAIIDYYLKANATGPVILAIFDAQGKLVRRYSSAQQPKRINPATWNYPTYWVAPPKTISAHAGMHRFVWDLFYPSPHVLHPTLSSNVILHDTPIGPLGPMALPGRYTVELTVDGHTYSQPLTVKRDPRVKLPAAGEKKQFELATKLCGDIDKVYAALQESDVGHQRKAALRTLYNRLLAHYNSLYGGSYGGLYGNPSSFAVPTRQMVEAVARLDQEVSATLGD